MDVNVAIKTKTNKEDDSHAKEVTTGEERKPLLCLFNIYKYIFFGSYFQPAPLLPEI